ncbi:MAG: ABC transporter permease [Pseudomonadota bacterium]
MPEQAQNANLRLALQFALRELRGGLRGFYIFLGCIALGVAAIGGVNSVAQSITNGIASEGQAILGGDLSFSLAQREITAEQIAFLKSQGEVTKLITMRGMARLPDGSDQTLVEIKAIDEVYPHYGSFDLSDNRSNSLKDNEVAAEPLLLERLGLKPGDRLEIGSSIFNLVAEIEREPDKVGDNIGFGPRLMMSLDGLAKTGLIQPGSLLRYHYKVKVDDPTQARIAAVSASAKEAFPDSGWRIRSRENAAPALTRSVERFSQFLTLVGLTSLIVGGVGVANATRAFLETKRPVIASLKSLGASGSFIFKLYMVQILIMAALGITLGLILAVMMPYGARYALSDLLPVSDGAQFFPAALAPGILYGVLTTLIFSIWPLAVSQETKPTELFRASTYGENRGRPKRVYVLALLFCVATLITSAIYFSDNRFISLVFVGATIFAFVMLKLVAVAIQFLAKNAPSVRSTPLKMAIANIHRPGALTASVTLSLGLGLALLVALATIDGNLRSQIENNLPEDAPDFFFVDIQNDEIEPFRSKLLEIAPQGKIISVPMLRGRVVSLKGIPSEDYKTVSGGEWVLQGDRGITYAKRIPENSTLSQGEWWPEGYSGPPLVSVSAEEAGELGLDIGDDITINVLGRNITAKIQSFREVQWETLGINFVFVFSPNTFAGAPHAHLATLTTNDAKNGNSDGTLLKELARTFPAVTAVRIRDALETVNGLISQLSNAIRAAASVALLSSVLVLAGALAAGNRERVHDAVVLKTLGATRGTLMRMLVLEYGLLGFSTAIFAILAGSLAAWFVISIIMNFTFVIQPTIALTTVATALLFTIVLGLLGTWQILGQKAAPILREL